MMTMSSPRDQTTSNGSGDHRREPTSAQSSRAASASPAKRNEQQEPQDDAASTPTASAQRPPPQQGTAPTSIPKDRPCPFCHQLFTSSSLGRHLDLYIRERNPKPPDGVHDVEKIRKIRAGITRRQARGLGGGGGGANGNKSSTEKDRHDSSPSRASTPDPDGEGSRVELNRRAPPLDSARFSHGFHILNKADWTATGVINNLPPRSTTAPILSEAAAGALSSASSTRTEPGLARGTVHHGIVRKETAPHDRDRAAGVYSTSSNACRPGQQQESPSASARAAAIERALKSVLESVRQAITRTHRAKLFDFDFFSMSFPGLCLRILPPPNALDSSTPDREGRNSGCCSLDPPGHAQREALEKLVVERIDLHRQQLQAYTLPIAPGKPENQEVGMSESEQRRHLNHLLDSFSHWLRLTEKERQESWQVELLRGCTQEREARKKAESKLEEVQEELAELKAERTSSVTQKQSAPYAPWSASTSYNPSSSSQYAPIQRPYNKPPQQTSSASSSQAQQYPSWLNELYRLQERPEYGAWSNRSALRHLPLETVQEIKRLNASIGKWDYDSMIEKFGGPAAATAQSSGTVVRASAPPIPQSYTATSAGNARAGFTAANDKNNPPQWRPRSALSNTAYEQRGLKRQRLEVNVDTPSRQAGRGQSHDMEEDEEDENNDGEEHDGEEDEEEEEDDYEEEDGEEGYIRREYGAYDGHGNGLSYQGPRQTKDRQEYTRQLIGAGRDTTVTTGTNTTSTATRRSEHANGRHSDEDDDGAAEIQEVRRRRYDGSSSGIERREDNAKSKTRPEDPDRRYRDLDAAILENVIKRDRAQ